MAAFQSLIAATAFRVAHFVPVREILACGSLSYRELIPRTGGPAALAFRDWFFANARHFDGSHNVSQWPFRGQVGREAEDPFGAAQSLAGAAGLGYWEGYAVDSTLPSPFAVHHAWNTAGDTLVDVTRLAGHSRTHYIGVAVPDALLNGVQTELAVAGRLYHGPLAFLAWAGRANNPG